MLYKEVGGRIISQMAKVDSSSTVDTSKEYLKMTRLMAMVSILMSRAPSTLETGIKTKSMVKASFSGPTVQGLKDNLTTVNVSAMANS